MKQFLLLAFFLLISQEATSQQHTREMNDDLTTYIGFIHEAKYDSMLHYVNPKIFELFSKEQFTQLFTQLFETEGITFTFGAFEVLQQYDGINYNGRELSMVDYRMDMNMQLTSEEMKESAELMVGMMEMQFGEENVSLNKDNHTFHINAKKTMFAEYVDDRWTFINYEPGQVGLMNHVIPEEAQTELLKNKYSE